MSKSALRGAMEIAEKFCKNYTGDREPLEDGAKEMFAKVHNIIGALGYPTLKDELIAVQKITDIVLKSATPCGFYEKEHDYLVVLLLIFRGTSVLFSIAAAQFCF